MQHFEALQFLLLTLAGLLAKRQQRVIDYLATELLRHHGSLKAIQRAIVTSATYRQSSRYNPAAAKVDAGNRLLWRKSPVRLEAEVLRDAILLTAGELNRSMGGPGYEDFTTFTRNTQFYEPLDAVGSSFHRRSLYRTWVRSGRNRFLDVFDCQRYDNGFNTATFAGKSDVTAITTKIA